MTKTYYPIDTAAGQTHHIIAGRTSQTTDPGTGSPVEYQQSIGGQATDAPFLCLYTPSGEPNSADWPPASAGDPFRVSLDVVTAGADLQYGFQGGHWARVNGALGADLESTQPTPLNVTGTGIKVWSLTSKDFAAGAASDRFEVFIASSNSSMMAETLGVNINTSNTFIGGPWVDADIRRNTLSIRKSLQHIKRASLM